MRFPARRIRDLFVDRHLTGADAVLYHDPLLSFARRAISEECVSRRPFTCRVPLLLESLAQRLNRRPIAVINHSRKEPVAFLDGQLTLRHGGSE